VLKFDPDGMLTRTLPPLDEPPHPATTANAITHATPATRSLTWKRERMLEEHSSSDGIDISLSSSSRATHLTNGAERRGGREPLVHETHGKTGSFLQLGGNVACLDGAGRILAILVEGKANDKALHLELHAAPNHLGDRRPFAAPALDEAGG
jgi:hypothetical protein